MKRDPDLIRKLMLAIEAATDRKHFNLGGHSYIPGHLVRVEGYPAEDVAYHLGLLTQSPWTYAIDMTTVDEPRFLIRLTHDGRDFLDLARDDARWDAARRIVQQATGACDLVFLEAVLKKQAADMVAAIH